MHGQSNVQIKFTIKTQRYLRALTLRGSNKSPLSIQLGLVSGVCIYHSALEYDSAFDGVLPRLR